MAAVLIDATIPVGKTSLAIHCGKPDADIVFNFGGIRMVRVWEDGELAAFDAAGNAVMFLRPGFFWAFLWQ